MSVPVARSSNRLAANQIPSGFSRPAAKRLARRQEDVTSDGLLVGAKVEMGGFVAATGLQMVGILSREAAFQSNGDPAIEARVNFIVDRYAEFVGNEISRFGF